MAKKRFPQDLTFAGETVRYAFDNWQAETLGKLLTGLEEVREEMESYDGDALIADHWDELGIAADYAGMFGDPSEWDDDDWPLTFDYRLANVEEDIMYVEQLVEGLGQSFKFDDLPKPKYMNPPAA